MISAFHKKSKVGGCTNSTFLALLPKEVDLASFDMFRPISLYNASYKIMAKLLANRLNPLLGFLISPLHGGLFFLFTKTVKIIIKDWQMGCQDLYKANSDSLYWSSFPA